MTKVHETYIRDTMTNIKKYIQNNVKGEMTMVVDNLIEVESVLILIRKLVYLLAKCHLKILLNIFLKSWKLVKK